MTTRPVFLDIAARAVALPDAADAVGWRILRDYGAVFATTAEPPPYLVFPSPGAVDEFQERVGSASADLAGIPVTLQRPALDALLAAAEEARELGLSVSPRGTDAAARSWGDSESLWRGRVERAAAHWLGEGALEEDEVNRLLALAGPDQVAAVLECESRGVWFSTWFDKSILYSVAAPGTSQHLAMLAFDVEEFADPEVRRLMERHGWFQTVISDLPHFTYLGRREDELVALGLRREVHPAGDQDYAYWVPDLPERHPEG